MGASRHESARGRTRGGFTLIELMLVMSVLMVALLLLSRSLGTAMRLTDVNRETALAADGARQMIELMRGNEDFSQVFALYNDDPDDDPGLPGSAPGAGFAVNGLDPVDGDPDGLVGEIRFPTVLGAGGLELREDVLDESLGMPRDLDGNGAVDAVDHGDDYRLLPVSLTLRWKGVTGVRSLEVQTLLADL